MERPRSKPSSKVESHPQNCSAGNQKTSQKYGRSVGSLRDIEEKDDALWYMADGMRRTINDTEDVELEAGSATGAQINGQLRRTSR